MKKGDFDQEKLETPDFIEEERQQCDWNEARGSSNQPSSIGIGKTLKTLKLELKFESGAIYHQLMCNILTWLIKDKYRLGA